MVRAAESDLDHGWRSQSRRMATILSDTVICQSLTRAPLGYFYNAPHWGGGAISSPPPSDLRNYWTDSKNASGI